ncbi:MAG: GNAT family protein [Pseudomonadota bacterium]
MTMEEPRPSVLLRDPQEEDAHVHFSHPPTPEIVRMYGGDSGAPPRADRERSKGWLRWLRDHPFAKIILCDGDPVGHVRLHAWRKADKRARLAIGLFAETHLGRGIGREAVRLTLHHAFGSMGLHRVDLRVLAYNQRAIRCYAACGFVHEGTEREAALVGDAWVDEWIMGVLSHEHRLAEG